MALAAYRAIIRSAKLAFEGDSQTLTAALTTARQGFIDHRTIDASEAPALIRDAEQIANVLRMNVVQGKREESDTYKLRIHKDTERGDNESIKNPTGKPAGGKCCSE